MEEGREDGGLLYTLRTVSGLSTSAPRDAVVHTSQQTALRGKQPHLSAFLLLSPDISWAPASQVTPALPVSASASLDLVQDPDVPHQSYPQPTSQSALLCGSRQGQDRP